MTSIQAQPTAVAAPLEARARQALLGCMAMALFVGLGLLFSCSPREDSGTNTNWMRQCVASSECDDTCLCGRCSSECTRDDDCPVGNVCVEAQQARLQCGGESTRSCQPRCSTDSECEAGRICHRGACSDALPALDGCPSEALFCDDFEREPASEYVVAVTEGNQLERVSIPTPSGAQATVVSVGVAPSAAYLRASLPEQQSGELYLSGWVRVPDEATHDVAPLALWASGDQDWALRMVLRDGGLEMWTFTAPILMGPQLELGSWHCIQARVLLDDAGEVELFLDGESFVTAMDVDALPTGGVDAVAWGSLWVGAAPASVAVDRVVVSTSPVDCFE